MTPLHDRADRVAGTGRAGELGGQRELPGRLRLEREHGLDDDPEAALGADEEPGEVVSGDALRGAAAGAEETPVREDDVEAEDVFGGDPVLDAAQAAGGGPDVAADGAHLPAGGVRRVVQPVLVDRAGQHRVDDARLHHGDPVDGADLQDAVHLGQGEHDAAVGGVGGARQARAGPLWDDRDAQGRGGAHDVLDLLDVAWERDDGRGARLAETRHVVGVGGGDVRVGDQGLGREPRTQ